MPLNSFPICLPSTREKVKCEIRLARLLMTQNVQLGNNKAPTFWMDADGDCGGKGRETDEEILVVHAVDVVAVNTVEAFIAKSLRRGNGVICQLVLLPFGHIDSSVRLDNFMAGAENQNGPRGSVALAKFRVGLFDCGETSTCADLKSFISLYSCWKSRRRTSCWSARVLENSWKGC